jgi:hypothetical protein
LTITFEDECPKDLRLVVMPETILPFIPTRNTIPDAIRDIPKETTIEAQVTSCPPGSSGPSSVVVTLQMDPDQPGQGTPEAGGHFHNTTRPKGTFEPTVTPTEAMCTATLDAHGRGKCSVTYRSSPVSGVETIIGQASDFRDAEAKVNIQVPGLVNLRDIRPNFFRFTGQTGTHPDNHWATPNTFKNIQLVALDFAELTCATPATCAVLRINDMSLKQGGVFDICARWDPAVSCPPLTGARGGHHEHRTGTSVDIGLTACRGLVPDNQASLPTDCPPAERSVSVARDTIGRICFNRGRATMKPEATHHCEWPQ